ncbi:macro domain-containing protein [Xanthomonas campestris pv. raphani]|uniref:type II toxin-antitoxin system antitoxin DNA ADP-ribosyl glycohydrolase DarG n=1 Tax=Xanthomonas campestris TaxID=339 RepID=UPI002B23C9EA|nr:macro domain-containing protein [Xanthomonas campestris]MEA9773460.1 macro domain-containing protein [Xanthomonas campestris pv. raphani]MEA9801665.1 macro domain-containing protein [Xanthomonas campestris pv. raphani]MEA9833584.1 macro domain-containing protein [Xanthomonas campestris pv. raphani]MEA9951111.1 macro domain-containing protein [Xanthomonas campestris pv. raphani]MEA9955090.1 macro domain-containing protein [Xanthomonas campestris pv. raphani]
MTNMTFKAGDMFLTNADAIVNTVNCVGVMGKGVALEFKRRWPENYKLYKKVCDRRELRPGQMLTYDRGSMFESDQPRFLINFPTKDHWRAKSKIEYIESGLDALVDEIKRRSIKSVAVPPLGCGNGGLDWSIVKPLIIRKLSVLSGVRIEIYGPLGEGTDPEYLDVSAKMTRSRAIFIKAIASLEPRFGGSVDRLSLQKLAYFLQYLGVPFNLEFKNSLYGPYSSTLKKALVKLDKWRYLSGYVDGHRSASVTSAGYAAADEYIRVHNVGEDVVDKLAHLFQGYDSPYGLELLSTTHFNASRGLAYDGGDHHVDDVGHYRKNVFPPNEVKAARDRLIEDGLLDHEDSGGGTE